MAQNTMFFRRHYEFLAEQVGPLLSTPTDAERLADMLEQDNPAFKRGVFVSKAVSHWEKRNLPDNIYIEVK